MFERTRIKTAGALIAAVGLLVLSACALDTDRAKASAAEDQRRPIPAPTRPLGSSPAARSGAGPQPGTDLTREGAVAWDTALPEIIDTRTFAKQINASTDWKGPIRDVEEILPAEAEIPRRGTPTAPDAQPIGSIGPDPTTRTAAMFPGLTQTPWSPPDLTLAVGRDHIVETVNMVVAFYTKSGTLQFAQNLNSAGGFFGSLGAGGFTFDPKCFYDHLTDRFVVLALEWYDSAQESWITFAVSDDGDPNGIWHKYRTNAVINVGGFTYWWDYPGFGYDGLAYYVTGNLFGLNNGGWAGVGFRVIRKAEVLDGLPAVYSTLRDGNGASCQVAQHFGATQTPFFVSVESSSQLRINSIKTPLTTPTLMTTFVTIPPFNWLVAQAPNIGGVVNTIDERIFNVVWRGGNMFAGHHVYSNGKTVARWYHLRTNSWPTSGAVTLHQSGEIDLGPGIHSYFPAIYTNRCADAGMVLGSSTDTTTPDIRVTGRRFDDPLGQMGAPTTIITSPNGTNGRWGDYFGMAVDPVDDTRFWFIGEYSTGGGWASWIGSFLVSCPADFNCDGFVDGIDYDQFFAAFENPDPLQQMAADYNHDRFVDGIDYDSFNRDFESLCP